MAGCVTQVDLDAAQTVLDGLQTAISEARATHETQLAAAEAAEAKEKERLWSEAHEAGEEEDEEGGKTKKRMVAMYALYNGHGFSVRSRYLAPPALAQLWPAARLTQQLRTAERPPCQVDKTGTHSAKPVDAHQPQARSRKWACTAGCLASTTSCLRWWHAKARRVRGPSSLPH